MCPPLVSIQVLHKQVLPIPGPSIPLLNKQNKMALDPHPDVLHERRIIPLIEIKTHERRNHCGALIIIQLIQGHAFFSNVVN